MSFITRDLSDRPRPRQQQQQPPNPALRALLDDDPLPPIMRYADAGEGASNAQMNEGKRPDGTRVPRVDAAKYDPGKQQPVGPTSQALSDAGVSHHVDATDPKDPHVHADDDAHDVGKKLMAAGFVHQAHGQHPAPGAPVTKCGSDSGPAQYQGTRVNGFTKGGTTVVTSHKPSSYSGGKYQDGKTAVTAHDTPE